MNSSACCWIEDRPQAGGAVKPALPTRRRAVAAVAERALHHHGIEPAAELEADIGMGADHLESAYGVHADRSGVGGIADHRDHLPVAARLRFRDQPLQQLQADAAPVDRGLEIDRILHGEAIGRPRPVGARIGVADHAAFEAGDQIGKAAVHQRAEAPRHLGKIRRDQLERRGAVADRVLVDRGNKGQVGRAAGLISSGGHGGKIIFARPQKKSPGHRPGL